MDRALGDRAPPFFARGVNGRVHIGHAGDDGVAEGGVGKGLVEGLLRDSLVAIFLDETMNGVDIVWINLQSFEVLLDGPVIETNGEEVPSEVMVGRGRKRVQLEIQFTLFQ